MSMNSAPKGERIHIGFFGGTNVGKSSLINAVTNQEISIVSPIAGTTTDPVGKTMELLPLGPVVITDTAGLGDSTELGQKRMEKTLEVLNKTDIAVLVASTLTPPSPPETELLASINQKDIPSAIALNKSDLGDTEYAAWKNFAEKHNIPLLTVSALTGQGINKLKDCLSSLLPDKTERMLIRDIVRGGGTCVLVVPIDSSAPKGRLILPQQQVIRDLLEGGATALVTKDTEYAAALASLKEKPALVVTDSQVFDFVNKLTPENIPLTSFSILFARYKGELKTLVKGARAADTLNDGDNILICEGCTHHRQCDDIGSVKIPKWLETYTKKKFQYTFSSGSGFPSELSSFKLAIHCGACMLNRREMKYRLSLLESADIPVVNYGVLIAHLNGILKRAIQPFETVLKDFQRDF